MILPLIIAPVLIFTSFLLLLLVTLSVPIITTIYLFRLSASISSAAYESGVSEWANFGVWGYCLTGKANSDLVGISVEITNLCSDRHLGYRIDDTVAKALNATDLNNTIDSATAATLVFNPIVTGLIFLSLLLSLFTLWRGSRGTSRAICIIITFVQCFIAFLGTVTFLIDIIIVAVVRNLVYEHTDGVHVMYGNAVWMALGAAISLWVATFATCFGCVRTRKLAIQRQAMTEAEKVTEPRPDTI